MTNTPISTNATITSGDVSATRQPRWATPSDTIARAANNAATADRTRPAPWPGVHARHTISTATASARVTHAAVPRDTRRAGLERSRSASIPRTYANRAKLVAMNPAAAPTPIASSSSDPFRATVAIAASATPPRTKPTSTQVRRPTSSASATGPVAASTARATISSTRTVAQES
jgi:hypothetical protein